MTRERKWKWKSKLQFTYQGSATISLPLPVIPPGAHQGEHCQKEIEEHDEIFKKKEKQVFSPTSRDELKRAVDGCDCSTEPLSKRWKVVKVYVGTGLNYDGKRRCWATDDPNIRKYHDEEWGKPNNDPDNVFEKMTIEMFQCGLTWKYVFSKRSALRKAFSGFDIEKVARFSDRAIERLAQNEQIIRNRAKIKATINNAKRILDMGKLEFVKFLWQHSPSDPNERLLVDSAASHMRTDFNDKNYAANTRSDGVHPTKTCVKLSKALKTRGFKFMGPTVTLSFMQAIGLMNHHRPNCWVFERNEALHKKMMATFAGYDKQKTAVLVDVDADLDEDDDKWSVLAKPGVKVEWMWPPGHKNTGKLTGKLTAKSVHAVTDKSGSSKYLPKSGYGDSSIANGWQLA